MNKIIKEGKMIKKLVLLLFVIILLICNSIFVSAANNDVSILTNLGILCGYEDGDLKLDNFITRAEFTKVIVESSKYKNMVSEEIQISIFRDVKHTFWAAPYIYVALENSLITGYEDATFKPNNAILFEECLAIVNRMLGYSKEDYNISWPHGPVTIAKGLGLLQGVECEIGQKMTRGDVSKIIINMLVSKNKDNNYYVSELSCSLKENVEIISIDAAGTVLTDDGKFDCKYKIDKLHIGKKGTLLLNQYEEILGFIPFSGDNENRSETHEIKDYTVYTVLDNTIVTYIDEKRYEFTVNDDVTVYKDGLKSNFMNVKVSLKTGDVLTVRYAEGIMQYVVVNESESGTMSQIDLSKYVVDSILGDKIITYINDKRFEISINNDVPVYIDGSKLSYTEAKDLLATGDTLSVRYNNGIIQYIIVDEITSNTISQSDLSQYVYYSSLNDSILVYKNNNIQKMNIKDDTVVYSENIKTCYGEIKSKLNMGDILNIKYVDEIISYIVFEKGKCHGPVTVTSSDWQKLFTKDISAAQIIKNGEICTSFDILTNDVLYYYDDLNMIFVYSQKNTGVYQSASPNKDVPATVTVSGKSYEIESEEAFNKLSSIGMFNFGDSVTLLLGKDGKIADVISPSNEKNLVYFVKAVGTKEFEVNGKTNKSYYVSLVSPDGSESDYPTLSLNKDIVNSIVKVTFSDGYAKLNKITDRYTLGGKFNWENKTLGKYDLASDVKILDIYSTTDWKPTLYKSIYPQRLDGVIIYARDVAYYELDEKNRVSKLILKNITGDMIKYGIVTKMNNINNENYLGGTYEYDIAGTSYSLSTTDSIFLSIEQGVPAKFVLNNEEVQSMSSLNLLKDEVTELSNTYLKCEDNYYLFSDEIIVYLRNHYYSDTYFTLDLNELIENKDVYSMKFYYDRAQNLGGRIRVIVATKK